MNRTLKHLLFVIISCLALSVLSYGQDTTTVQKQSLNYFKIEVGIVIDCPVLPPRLIEKLGGLKGIKDCTKNQPGQNITFNIPEGVVTKEQILAMAVSCGFPAHLVNILIADKPFVK